jgi:hypothetical protein
MYLLSITYFSQSILHLIKIYDILVEKGCAVPETLRREGVRGSKHFEEHCFTAHCSDLKFNKGFVR